MGADTKRFYWIKIKDTFLTSETVDFLMSQKNGADYVVLYQMLCLKSINTDGKLCRQIGEILVPYNAEKIQRDCKWFTIDTIFVALDLYKKLGLIIEQEDGIFEIVKFAEMVGSESDSAERVRQLRARKNELKALQCNADCNESVTETPLQCNDNVTKCNALPLPLNPSLSKREENKRLYCSANAYKEIKERLKKEEGAYFGYQFSFEMHPVETEQIIRALLTGVEQDEQLTINGKLWTGDDWQNCLETINCTRIGGVIERIIKKDETNINNQLRYVLGLIAYRWYE